MESMSFKKLSAILLTFSILLVATGCQLFKGDSISTTDVFKTQIATKTGFYGEKFIPQDAVMVGAFDMQDKSQTGAFNILRSKFIDDVKWQEIKDEAYADFDESTVENGLNFKDGFLPVWGENPRFVVAIDKKAFESFSTNSVDYSNVETPISSEDLAASSEEDISAETIMIDSEPIGSMGTMTGFEPKNFEGTALFVAKIENVEKYNELIKYLVEKEKMKKVEGQDDDVYEVEGVFVGRYQDMLVVTNSLENWLSAVKRARTTEPNITDNKSFKEVFGHLIYPHAMYFYQDAQAILDVTVANLSTNFPSQTTDQQAAAKKFADFYSEKMGFIKASGTAVVLEDEGVRFKSYAFADEEKLKSNEKGFVTGSDELTLLKKIPGEGVILYEEMSESVVSLIGDFGGVLLPLGGITVEDFKDQFKAVTGLDWEKDVASFAKKNIAFYITDSGSFVPGFGFAIDASADVEAAKRTMTVLNSNLSLLLTGARASMTEEQSSALVQAEVEIKGKTVNKVSYDVSKLSAEALAELGVPENMKDLVAEFYYGVTGDNVFLVALHQNLDKLYGKSSLGGSKEYKKALNQLGDNYENGIMVYFNTAPALALVDRWVEASGASADYDEIKKYIQPLQSIIVGANTTRTEDSMMGYISIQ